MILKRLFILSAVLLTLEACSSVVSKTVAQSSLPPNGAEKPQPPPRIDFAAASRKLGVSEAQLKAALGVPDKPPTKSSTPPPPPNLQAAAAKLGVTEAKLIEALGIPPHPPGDRPSTTR